MISRYTRAEMGRIWSEQNKYEQWLAVELAASETLAELGQVPTEAVAQLRAHAGFTVDRIEAIERETRHDVIAFTTAVAEAMAAAGHAGASRWFHFGMTSNDVVDTAQACQMKQAADLILAGIDPLLAALEKRAREYQHAVQIGRTHGIHAEPITFGLKLALWFDELRRNRRRFAQAAEEARMGKISGAVGTLAHLPIEAEESICAKLGLRAAPISSQVLSRDLHAGYIAALVLVCATLEKIALEEIGRASCRERV